MPQAIVRIYANEEAANAAVNELQKHGFKARIIKGENTGIYADHFQRGEVPVIVDDPPFGSAQDATNILESHNPVKADLPEADLTQHDLKFDWNSPTPLSSCLGWQLLLDDPTPLSNSLNKPVLKAESASSPTLKKIQRQSGNPTPLSSRLGLPLLYEKIGLLSTKLGWRLLLDDAALLSERFGWQVLTDNPTPVSTKFKWRVLLDDPTPLSSALGWKVLA